MVAPLPPSSWVSTPGGMPAATPSRSSSAARRADLAIAEAIAEANDNNNNNSSSREDRLGKANAARAQVLEPQQQLPGLPSSEQFPTGELKLNNNTNNNYKNYNNNRDSQS
eukprot:CAMPEP_0115149506 /NCGR_PEP_ID=MMETSP0227-20121206/64485_1 /TAXON_ID=89957 /ORGANISM="Polarella glacialis, Strain CCMP 1383" /LENGTH=110 /DNA_ID=CAMNT_0002559695 /DNA_START=170 /DNA_END=503 /DNA_ORIENTATION=-